MLFGVIHHSILAQISESDIKAAYIERFTRFVEWPQELENNNFNDTFKIAVFGNNPFKTSVDELFADVKIKGQNVEIIYTNKLSELTKVNLVFLSSSEKRRIKEVLTEIGEKPILIISDSKGFSKMGIHINMYIDGNHIRYEINQEALEGSGLKVSSLLLASAKIVKTDE